MSKVKKGYKQTEVGVIPEDWDVVRAKDACLKIQDGTHFSPKISGNDYLYITSKNIRFGFLDLSTADRIDEAQHRSIYKRCDVSKGDLLLTKDGANTGNSALNTLDEEFSLLSSVAFLRFHKDKYSASYFLQVILSSAGQNQIKEAMSGNAITRLTLEKINKLVFPVPSNFTEQAAIATALSDADALIESLEQLIHKKRQIKQGAMQELLTGKKRLPGFSGEWEVRRLGDVATIATGNTPPTSDVTNYGDEFLFVSPADLGEGKYINATEKMLSRKGFASARRFPKNSILFVCIGSTIGKCGVATVELASNQQINAIFPSPVFDTDFLYYVCCVTASKIRFLAGEQAVPLVNKTQFSETEIGIPTSKEEQTAIATIFSDMDAELAALEEKLGKAKAVKQGMMQELLTGRVRLV